MSEDVSVKIYTDGDEKTRIDLMKRREVVRTMMISLLYRQFLTLYHINMLVIGAIKKKAPFRYLLGDQIYVSHELFNNKWTVNLREWYIDEAGEEAPGMYGINMEEDEWFVFTRKHLKNICKLIYSVYINYIY